MTSKYVKLDLVWLILAGLVGACVFLYGFLKKMNEWYYAIRLGKIKHSSLPPGDMGWPFIGNMISYIRAFGSRNPDSFFDNFVNRYGQTGIYKTHLFGNPTILVCSPELCRKILTDDEQFIPGYPSSLMKLAGENSLVRVPNLEHKRLRKLLIAPINGHEALSIYIGYIEDIVVSSLKNSARNNSPTELLTELTNISFNVITKIFMGSTDSITESVSKYYTLLFRGAFSLLPFNVPGFAFHQALKARKILVNIIQAHVDERRHRDSDDQNTKKGMIDQLLEAKDEEGYIIPKGWKVLVSQRPVHMNSEIYSNPNQFLPSRWDNHNQKAGSFIPFGAGSRTCPGADLAKIEMFIFFHYFLLNYKA